MLNESKYEKDANGNIIMTIHTSSFYGYQTNKTIQFDDGEFFGENILNFHIYKIVGLFDKENKLIKTIEFFYREVLNGELIGPRKRMKTELENIDITVYILDSKENIIDFSVNVKKGYIQGVVFYTNKSRELQIGDITTKKVEKKERYNNYYISFYGGIDEEGLRNFGGYYIKKRDYVASAYAGIFYLKHLIKHNAELKEKIKKEVEMNKYPSDLAILLKLCLCSEYLFFTVMRYVSS